MTKEQLQAENKALRELLAAARAYADLPRPASYGDHAYNYECEVRLSTLAVYANGDRKNLDDVVYALVLRDRAQELRDRAARPLRYKTRDAEPANAEPVYPEPGSTIPTYENFGLDGFVVGICGHRVAESEWRAGFRTCERCPVITAANLDETPSAVTS